MINKILSIVEKELACSAHDLMHTHRVYKNCMIIAKNMKDVDMELLKVSSLLHDIARVREDADNTEKIDHATEGAEMARKILLDLGCDNSFIEKVSHAIQVHRYRGSNIPITIEEKILFDADKLDILGAIGIARSYMIAGSYKEPIYRNVSVDDYISENIVGGTANGRIIDISKHAPNLEYELKLKMIPQRLYTDEAKKVAEQRLSFMENYFNTLGAEIEGEI